MGASQRKQPIMQKNKAISLAALAELVGGELRGDANLSIDNAWPIDHASNGTITMLDKVEHLRNLEGTQASAVILPSDAPEMALPAIVVEDPHKAFEKIVLQFRQPPVRRGAGIHPSALIDPSATLGSEISIGPNVVIEANTVVGDGVVIGANSVIESDCQIGDESWIGANVTIYWGTILGKHCRMHSGVVLGADGFGYRQVGDRHEPVPQLGTVELGDYVEIGANTAVDRGVYGPTIVGEGTKIDNSVQVGHNCQIGKHNLLCAQVGIGGSSSTGDYVVMAGQVGMRDHVHVGTGAIISGMSGVANNVPEGEVMLGIPATPQREQKLQIASVSKLPQMRKEFKKMRKQLDSLLKESVKEQEESTSEEQATDRAA